MPQYKLTYFPFRARGEVTRMLFRLGGQEFEDDVVNMKDWPQLKPNVPFGQLPLLEEEGKVICQSNAINRYLAKKFGYAGKTDWEQAQIDMVVDCLEDFTKPAIAIFYCKDQNIKGTLRAEYIEKLPSFMRCFEKMLLGNASGYFIGDEMTWADLSFAEYVMWPTQLADYTVDLCKYPKCKALQERVQGHPVIAAYLSERWPETKAE